MNDFENQVHPKHFIFLSKSLIDCDSSLTILFLRFSDSISQSTLPCKLGTGHKT